MSIRNRSFDTNDTIHRVNPKNIFCKSCRDYTICIEPIIIRRYHERTFNILVMCAKCKNLKSCAMSDYNNDRFPDYFFDLPLGMSYFNYVPDGQGQNRRIINSISYTINGRR